MVQVDESRDRWRVNEPGVAEKGQMERTPRGRKGWKKLEGGLRGMRWWGGGLCLKPPSARNNKQAFSYSNKYRASGEHRGAADKEEAKRREPDGRMASLLH